MNRKFLTTGMMLGVGLLMAGTTSAQEHGIRPPAPEPEPQPEPKYDLEHLTIAEVEQMNIQELNELGMIVKDAEAILAYQPKPVVPYYVGEPVREQRRVKIVPAIKSPADLDALAKAQAKRKRKALRK